MPRSGPPTGVREGGHRELRRVMGEPTVPRPKYSRVLLKLGGFLVQTRFDIVWDEAAECAIYHPLGLNMIADITVE